mmetsp:Transcript_66731/g.159577  ORF Transcript_66731/g.159577 Transcript_66731/m.159577 type:complete len:200 (-) Transcript_66731:1706-2305(-)
MTMMMSPLWRIPRRVPGVAAAASALGHQALVDTHAVAEQGGKVSLLEEVLLEATAVVLVEGFAVRDQVATALGWVLATAVACQVEMHTVSTLTLARVCLMTWVALMMMTTTCHLGRSDPPSRGVSLLAELRRHSPKPLHLQLQSRRLAQAALGEEALLLRPTGNSTSVGLRLKEHLPQPLRRSLLLHLQRTQAPISRSS